MTGAADRGLFGPDSISWRVDREVLVLAGGSRRRARGVELLASATRRLLPLVPDPLRHVPAARSAKRRVARAGGGR